jgi:hypothetical protein
MAQQQAQTTSCEARAASVADARARLAAIGDTILSYQRRVDRGGQLTWDEVSDLIDLTCRIKRALIAVNTPNFLPSECNREQLDQYVRDLKDQDAKATALEDRLVLPNDLRRCRPVILPDGTQKSPTAKETVATLRSEGSLLGGGNGFRI